MKNFCSPNLSSKGRLVRGIGALMLLSGAGFAFGASLWLGIALAASGVFVLFEAVWGWCALRACGIKTRL
ncbi:MAG: DUF2892 domain-containing protein [Akkermansiaceae bacterium]|nr:DUF2892 domain-containing protein [Verrucomicrobiales bacterium]